MLSMLWHHIRRGKIAEDHKGADACRTSAQHSGVGRGLLRAGSWVLHSAYLEAHSLHAWEIELVMLAGYSCKDSVG